MVEYRLRHKTLLHYFRFPDARWRHTLPAFARSAANTGVLQLSSRTKGEPWLRGGDAPRKDDTVPNKGALPVCQS